MSEIEFNSLDDLLHNKIFAMPDYQRDYSWGKAEVSTLLEDIESLVRTNGTEGENEHFCGAIVAIPFDPDVSKNTKGYIQSRNLKNFDRYDVIDGQQRLSTLSLFLLALYNYAESNGLSGVEIFPLLDTGKKVDNRHVPRLNFADLDTQSCYYKLLYPADSTNLQFDNTRQGPKHLETAYKMCVEEIEKIGAELGVSQETIETVFEQVQYRLSFVDIYCKREVDAYQIFESLNSTGLSLTPAEQVKNLILMKSANTDSSLTQWEKMVNSIGEDDIVEYLAHYLFFKKHSRVGKKDIYETFKKELGTISVSDLLKDLSLCAALYNEIKNPGAENPAQEALLDLKNMNQKQAYVPLLAAASKFGKDTNDFAKIADAILVYIVRHLVCGQSSNKLDSVFGTACDLMVDESKQASDIVAYFKKERQPDGEFENYFKVQTFDYTAKPQRIAKTLLKRIEEKEHGANSPLLINPKDLTVEHIIPKTPTYEDLKNWIGEDADKDGFVKEDFVNQYIKSIGNMALLFGGENASVGNSSYDEKIKFYQDEYIKSGRNMGKPAERFDLIKELIAKFPKKFDGASIEKRAELLAKKAVKAWS